MSADSRQIYRGFDIGTAKPTTREQRDVPHRGIDVVEPTERYSAAKWAESARAVDRRGARGEAHAARRRRRGTLRARAGRAAVRRAATRSREARGARGRARADAVGRAATVVRAARSAARASRPHAAHARDHRRAPHGRADLRVARASSPARPDERRGILWWIRGSDSRRGSMTGFASMLEAGWEREVRATRANGAR